MLRRLNIIKKKNKQKKNKHVQFKIRNKKIIKIAKIIKLKSKFELRTRAKNNQSKAQKSFQF